MYNVQGSLREWVTRDEVRRFIARKFRQFLMTYVNPKNESGHPEYVRLIDEMVSGVYIGFSFVCTAQTLLYSLFSDPD